MWDEKLRKNLLHLIECSLMVFVAIIPESRSKVTDFAQDKPLELRLARKQSRSLPPCDITLLHYPSKIDIWRQFTVLPFPSYWGLRLWHSKGGWGAADTLAVSVLAAASQRRCNPAHSPVAGSCPFQSAPTRRPDPGDSPRWESPASCELRISRQLHAASRRRQEHVERL